VVHLDMKLSNILISEDLTHIVLIDFGISSLSSAEDLKMNLVNGICLGNEENRSPEIHNALYNCYGRSDIVTEVKLNKHHTFSLGVIIYEIAMQLKKPIKNYPMDYKKKKEL